MLSRNMKLLAFILLNLLRAAYISLCILLLLLRRQMDLLLLLFLFSAHFLVSAHSSHKEIFIAYLGGRTHQDPYLTSLHNDLLLASVFGGSLEDAEEAMVYSYKYGFRGFAAKLTSEQADALADMPHVVSVFKSHPRQLHTTRSWEFMGFPSSETGGLNEVGIGNQQDIIIGFLDTGIWPESKSFNDSHLPPVPARWKGRCQPGDNFTLSMCNRKVIGARYYSKGIEGVMGFLPTFEEGGSDYISPRDSEGHGSHTASTAAGRLVAEADLQGLANGAARGGAPLSRIAIYKVCWSQGCFDADILAAIDDAILDGVDILSLSLGPNPPQTNYFSDAISIGSFHAVQKGISVICSVGNNGPGNTATNLAPWILSVAASSIDRFFSSDIILGDNATYKGSSLSVEHLNVSSAQLIYAGDARPPLFTPEQSSLCLNSSLDPKKVRGKIVVCQHPDDSTDSKLEKSQVVKAAGGVGIVVIDEADQILGIPFVLPATLVGSQAGKHILSYIHSTRLSTGYITPTSTVLGYKPAPQVAVFSSRGPNTVNPDIMKPDVTAPGLNILAAWSPVKEGRDFNIVSGTSMSCPHVSGIAALIKASHSTWSPAAIKSAIMTTAYVQDNEQRPISCSPTGMKATPFDFGAGHVSPQKAQNPGLIYDIQPADYINFLCGAGYNSNTLHMITGDSNTTCSNFISPSNLNYPSITVSKLTDKATVMRTVTNVGYGAAIYKAVVEAPEGVNVEVRPNMLSFKSVGEKISFYVHFTAQGKPAQGYVFGSLLWTDGQHEVRSPLILRRMTHP